MLGLAIASAINCGFNIHKKMLPQRTEVYNYAIEQGIDSSIATKLEKKLSSNLDKNYREFIDTISKYDSDFQELSVNSSILENKKISKKELENVKNKKINSTETEIENPIEIYAVIANCSDSNSPSNYSKRNQNIAEISTKSFYKFLKDNNVPDENISFLQYIDSQEKLFETEEYKSLLERKISGTEKLPMSKILPTKDYEIISDGKATKKNFLEAIANSGADSNDKLIIYYHSASKKDREKSELATSELGDMVKFNDEKIITPELREAIKKVNEYCKQITILENLGGNQNLAKKLDNLLTQFLVPESERINKNLKGVLIISSPNPHNINSETLNNEIFTLNLIGNETKGVPLKENFESLKGDKEEVIRLPYAVFLDGVKKAPELCPWFDKSLLN